MKALVVVPPFLKYAAGPTLGPALLAAAGRRAGHTVDVIDLNQSWINERLVDDRTRRGHPFIGDHHRAPGLRDVQTGYFAELAEDAGRLSTDLEQMRLEFHEIDQAVARAAARRFGAWVADHLAPLPRPDVLGLSLLWSGQVFASMIVGAVGTALWPGVRVVWGGPHVTVLADEIQADERYRAVADGFVFGAAEQTFVDLLDAIAARAPLPSECARAGQPAPRGREDLAVTPWFGNLLPYRHGRLTLPAQTSRGCSYGLCEFCTYPTTEGPPRRLPLTQLTDVAALAAQHRADVSLKDSLVEPERIAQVADALQGAVRWSACTRLSARLTERLLAHAAAGGLATIEFGVETFVPSVQRLIQKRQRFDLFVSNVVDAARAGIAVVVNYVTGFPGEDAGESVAWLRKTAAVVRDLRPLAKLSHNHFELERRAPLAARGERAGLRVVRSWPWSSLLDWSPMQPSVGARVRLPLLGTGA